MTQVSSNVHAQAHIHHAYLLGLQLMVSSNKPPLIVGDWMFRLFRRQHLEKFLSSFEKLGLVGLPDAVACARYHAISNSVGGVAVEYMYESDRKAWVRFRYPRWMYYGPTICGVPIEVSRGFLQGWYAHNGVSLGNPRLGFVCVSEDMTGEFGFCGYFQEYDHELSEDERLQFRKDQRLPPYNPEDQPVLSSQQWSDERLARANRNYAIDYIRNGIAELIQVLGETEASALAGKAARLIGLQYLQDTLRLTRMKDGDVNDAADYLVVMFQGMGDEAKIISDEKDTSAVIEQQGLRIVRGLGGIEREVILNCWQQLWIGAMSSYRIMKNVDVTANGGQLNWTLTDIS